jgi:CRP/FNR family nitrogen fixation transcriptional regulator
MAALRRPFPPRPYLSDARRPGGHQGALLNDLRSIEQFSARVRFAKNETIFNEGDDVGHAYKIVSGMVRLCKHTQDGRRQIADFLLPETLFGIIDRGEYGFSAEAVTDVVLIAYPRIQIDRLTATTAGVSDRVFAVLTEQFMAMQRHLVVLGCHSAKERVASFLLLLTDRSSTKPGDRLDLPMGRQDIASHLGLTIETVCRAITELKREGLIAVPSLNQIVINNSHALKALAEGRHESRRATRELLSEDAL